MSIRTIFMGSPEFALASLRGLATNPAYEVVGVVTQPDREAGRGRALTPPPIKTLALELGLNLIQPRRLRDPEAWEQLQTWAPDLIVVAAFGQILRQNVLDLPRYGCINVHASLLPRWRGAAPIQAALLAGDAESGVTIMRMDAGIDTGPMLSAAATPLRPDDTAATLSARLAELGAGLLLQTLPGYLSGQLQAQPQPPDGETYAPMLKKEDGWLDFQRPADELERRVRAMHPWPGAYFEWQGQSLKVHAAHTAPAESGRPPGSTLVNQGLPAVAAADGLLVLDEVQPAGKKPMAGKVFLNGARGWE